MAAKNEIIPLFSVYYGYSFVPLLSIDELFDIIPDPPHATHFFVFVFQL